MRSNKYFNVVDAISDLQVRGFSMDFTIIGKKLLFVQEQRYLGVEEFEVLEMYRFQASSLSREQTVVYAIVSHSRPLKGILLNSCKV